jgi:dissimilatory sulfite reductase (desulfoviridin) alpha/beta subunit
MTAVDRVVYFYRDYGKKGERLDRMVDRVGLKAFEKQLI